MTTLEILGASQSTFVRTCCLTAQEKGADYTLVHAMPQSEALLAVGPTGKMPGMRHGAVTLFESLGICSYIDGVFDGPSLLPTEAGARARTLTWCAFTIDAMNHTVNRQILVPNFFAGEDGPDRSVIDPAVEKARPYLAAIDRAVTNTPFVDSDAISLADLFLFPPINYLKDVPEADQLFEPHAALKAWHARMLARPSASAVVAAAA